MKILPVGHTKVRRYQWQLHADVTLVEALDSLLSGVKHTLIILLMSTQLFN